MKIIRHYIVPGLLVTCTLLLAFWIVASQSSRQPGKPFDLNPEDFSGYQPVLEGWSVQSLPIRRDGAVDANVAAFSLVPVGQPLATGINTPAFSMSLLTRLVHGYNMPMCMKMKYYTVEKIQDHKVRVTTDPKLRSAFTTIKSISHEDAKHAKEGESGSAEGGEAPSSLRTLRASVQTPDLSSMESISIPSDYPLPVQVWRLTSSVGTVSIWATTMIRSDNFEPTTEDISTMAFPRIEIPDDPNWLPRGIDREAVMHPLKALKVWFHSKWDGARWDVLTFLGLRKPVRTSNELLSYVTLTRDRLPEGGDAAVMRMLLATHEGMLRELQVWRRR